MCAKYALVSGRRMQVRPDTGSVLLAEEQKASSPYGYLEEMVANTPYRSAL